MGIHPNVSILELASEFRYGDLEQALLTYSWMIKDLTRSEEERLKHFLQQRATSNPDGTITIRRDHPPRWTLIWWEKSTKSAQGGSTPSHGPHCNE